MSRLGGDDDDDDDDRGAGFRDEDSSSKRNGPCRDENGDEHGHGDGDGVYGEMHLENVSTLIRSSLGHDDDDDDDDDASRYSGLGSGSSSLGNLSGHGDLSALPSSSPLGSGSSSSSPSSPSPSPSPSLREDVAFGLDAGSGTDDLLEEGEAGARALQGPEGAECNGGNLSSRSSSRRSSTCESAYEYEFHWDLGEGEGDGEGEGSSAPSTPCDQGESEEGEGGCEEVEMETSLEVSKDTVERRAVDGRVVGDNGDGFCDPLGGVYEHDVASTRNHMETKVKSVVTEDEEEDEQDSEYLDVRLAAELFEKIVSPPSPAPAPMATSGRVAPAHGTTDSTSTTSHRRSRSASASRTRRQGMCPPPPPFGGTGPVLGAPGYSYFNRRDRDSLDLTSTSASNGGVGVGFCRLSLPYAYDELESSPPPPLPPLPRFPKFPLPPPLPPLPARFANANANVQVDGAPDTGSEMDADEKRTNIKNIEVKEQTSNLDNTAMTRSTSNLKTKGKKEFVDYKKELLDTVLAIENSFMEPFRRAGSGGGGALGGMSGHDGHCGHGDAIFGWDFGRAAREREKKKKKGESGVGAVSAAADGEKVENRRGQDQRDLGPSSSSSSSAAFTSVSGNTSSSSASVLVASLASGSARPVSSPSPPSGPPPRTRLPLRPSLKRRPSGFVMPQPSILLHEDAGKDTVTGVPVPKLPPPPMSMSVPVPVPVPSSAAVIKQNTRLVASHSPLRLQSQSQSQSSKMSMSVSPSSSKKKSAGSGMVVVNAYNDVSGRSSVPPPPIPSMAPPLPPPMPSPVKRKGAKIEATSSSPNIFSENAEERGSSLSILSTTIGTKSAGISSSSSTVGGHLNEWIIPLVPGHEYITRIRGPGKHIRKPSTYTTTITGASSSSSSSESITPLVRRVEIQDTRTSPTVRRGKGLGLGLSIPGPDSPISGGAIRIGVTVTREIVAAETEASRVGVGVVRCDSEEGEVGKGVIQSPAVLDEGCSEGKEKERPEAEEEGPEAEEEGPEALVDLENGIGLKLKGNGPRTSLTSILPCDELKTRTRVQTLTSALVGFSDHSGFVGLVSEGTSASDEDNKSKFKPDKEMEMISISKFPLVQLPSAAGAVTGTGTTVSHVSHVDVDPNVLSASRVGEVEVKLRREHIILRREMQMRMRMRTRRVGVGVGVGVMDDHSGHGGGDGVVIPPRISGDLNALCRVIGEGGGRAVGVVVGERF